jgi:hypothetical protein
MAAAAAELRRQEWFDLEADAEPEGRLSVERRARGPAVRCGHLRVGCRLDLNAPGGAECVRLGSYGTRDALGNRVVVRHVQDEGQGAGVVIFAAANRLDIS